MPSEHKEDGNPAGDADQGIESRLRSLKVSSEEVR